MTRGEALVRDAERNYWTPELLALVCDVMIRRGYDLNEEYPREWQDPYEGVRERAPW